MAAEIKGMVVFEEASGCLLLEHGEGSERVPVVWPDGASWRADPPAVVLRGQPIEPGSLVEGTGGYLPNEQVADLAGTAVANAAGACAGATGEIAYFNPGSNVIVVAQHAEYSCPSSRFTVSAIRVAFRPAGTDASEWRVCARSG